MTAITTTLEMPRPAAAKVRILETATELFYRVGIHAVGVDRLIGESAVTKATFYKHFGSKDRLILDYITAQHVRTREHLDELVHTTRDAEQTLNALVSAILADIASPTFRGCPFINAASEFPDELDPVRGVISRHRDWYTGFLAGLLQNLGHPMPGDAADELMLARDGAMSGAYAGDPIAASAAFARVAERVVLDATAAKVEHTA
ncbi:TetR family transcriptional regulator [Glaciihabitans tibetensis]|uniref:TetR family transcriptional regulator n=1 Tax=Glaciihabitans tibetensis TaxID=1266600 RepID=A0A2T0VHM3_9MICO|nr:TetR/AcrR family transcriptional regulator [Glaciihabitans tibetensis]PRY69700.1 TetR family transcriptional regulator [Glaciihabitans tibetensis]